MELAFDSIRLRTICENDKEAKRKLGTKAAEILRHRLADLCAATSIKDVIVGFPRRATVASQDMLLDLCDGHVVIFSANHAKNPVAVDGSIDWLRVSRIKIIQIERLQ